MVLTAILDEGTPYCVYTNHKGDNTDREHHKVFIFKSAVYHQNN